MPEHRRAFDGEQHVRLRVMHGRFQGVAQGQAGRHRRGKRTSCSVCVWRVDALRDEFFDAEHIGVNIDRRTVKVAAFDDDGLDAGREECGRGGAHLRHGGDAHPGQDLGFWNIGCDQCGSGQQDVSQDRHRIVGQKRVAAFGHHDRIEDDGAEMVTAERGGDDADDVGIGEHADLRGLDGKIVGHGVNLRGDDGGGQRLDGAHAECVLCGYSGDGGGAEHPMRLERAKVGLDARAAPRVTSRNCQSGLHLARMPAMSSRVISGSLVDRATFASPFASSLRFASVAFGMALTAAAAQFTLPIPFTAVPLVLTPMAVLLTGAALGARRGALTQAAYLAAGIIGLHVFAPSAVLPPGAARLFGPTGGYLMAYPLAAFLTGWLAERGWDRRYVTSALAMLAGLTVIHTGGVLWYTFTVTHSLGVTFATSVVPFAALDIAKMLIAAAVLPQAWRLLGRQSL